jgi:predicted nucleic acid-binding protein
MKAKLRLDWREMHRYCLRYSLETQDAAHVLLAKSNSQYLVTIDTALIKARISEVKVLDPGDLLTRMEL